MKVSLKSARLLAKQLDALINTHVSKTSTLKTIDIAMVPRLDTLSGPRLDTGGIVNEVEGIVDAANNEFKDSVDRILAMIDTIHSMRDKVAVVNAVNSIDAKVAESTKVTRKLAVYNQLLRTAEQNVIDIDKATYVASVCRNLQQMSTNTTGYRQTSMSAKILSDDDVRSLKKTRLQLTNQLEALRSELAVLNSKLEIELSDAEVCVLEYHSLM